MTMLQSVDPSGRKDPLRTKSAVYMNVALFGLVEAVAEIEVCPVVGAGNSVVHLNVQRTDGDSWRQCRARLRAESGNGCKWW